MVDNWQEVAAKLADDGVADHLRRWRRRHARRLDDADWSDLSTEAVGRTIKSHDPSKRTGGHETDPAKLFLLSLNRHLGWELKDYWERRGRRRTAPLEAAAGVAAPPTAAPPDLSTALALMERALPATVRQAVRLYYLEGLNLQEIAGRSGGTVDEVHQMVTGGIARLRQLAEESV